MSPATRMGNRATLRAHIDEAIVGEALYLASVAKDSNEVHDYADTEHAASERGFLLAAS
jgi:hypothetical protein